MPRKLKVDPRDTDSTYVDVIGYEGRYQVNIKGDVRVRMDGFWRYKKWRYLTGSRYNNGYLYYKFDNKERFSRHRLIAMHFIPNPYSKPHINHINGIKSDDRIDNLEWCTPKENFHHAIRTGLYTDEHRKAGIQKVVAKARRVTVDLHTGFIFDGVDLACEALNLNKNTEKRKCLYVPEKARLHYETRPRKR